MPGLGSWFRVASLMLETLDWRFQNPCSNPNCFTDSHGRAGKKPQLPKCLIINILPRTLNPKWHDIYALVLWLNTQPLLTVKLLASLL